MVKCIHDFFLEFETEKLSVKTEFSEKADVL